MTVTLCGTSVIENQEDGTPTPIWEIITFYTEVVILPNQSVLVFHGLLF